MKSEKGSITIYVTIACLFVLIIGIANYVLLSNKQVAQAEMVNTIEGQYNSDVSLEETYQNYMGGEIIPIDSLENFKKIGTGEQVYIDGKVYTFGIDSTYVLQTNLIDDGNCDDTIARIKENDIVVIGLFTIKYNANGGAGTMLATIGISPEVVSNSFTAPSGYVFKEWNSQADGNGTSYAVGTKINEDKTIYAVWKEKLVDENGLALKDTTITTSDPNVQIVIPAGFAPAILKGSNWTTSNPGQDGSVKELMKPEDWNKITAEDINKGIVIVNAASEEFVWVPIPNSSDFARTAWTIDGTQQTLAETSTADAYWEDKTSEEYTNMVSSVNENKGFYVSRYESSKGINNIPQSKRGQEPWWNDNLSCLNVITICNQINTNTHLLYGIEWDSILKWIEKETGLSSTESGNWGNHNDAVPPADTNPPYSPFALQNTGASEYWKANNIYDLAGNIYEYTKERYSADRRVVRGGAWDAPSYEYPAAIRDPYSEETCVSNARFPFQLFYRTNTKISC